MITLKKFLNTNLMFDKLTIMKHSYDIVIGKTVSPVYTYYIQLNHKHKRIYKTAERLLYDYGGWVVDQIEWHDDGNILIKISEKGMIS